MGVPLSNVRLDFNINILMLTQDENSRSALKKVKDLLNCGEWVSINTIRKAVISCSVDYRVAILMIHHGMEPASVQTKIGYEDDKIIEFFKYDKISCTIHPECMMKAIHEV